MVRILGMPLREKSFLFEPPLICSSIHLVNVLKIKSSDSSVERELSLNMCYARNDIRI